MSLVPPSPPPPDAHVRARRTAVLLAAVVVTAVAGTGVALNRRAGTVGADGQLGTATRTLAVLPFTGSGAPTAGPLADSVTGALTARLARLPQLRVAERTAAAAVARGERSTDPRHVGRTLAVALLLDGSVRRAGERVRVTARLTSAKESVVVWSDTFEADTAGLRAVEERITRGVADALRITLAADARGAGR